MSGSYILGTCNIGNDQLKKRKWFALKIICLTVFYILVLQVFHLDRLWRLPLFILFTLSSIGIQQMYFKFCYIFGLKGFYGFGEPGKAISVEEEEYKRIDRRKSTRMISSSLVIALLLTVIYFFLPI